jgi:hypothetical protein
MSAEVMPMTFQVMHYKRVQKFFPIMWGLWVPKNAEFYVDFVDFKHVNLP